MEYEFLIVVVLLAVAGYFLYTWKDSSNVMYSQPARAFPRNTPVVSRTSRYAGRPAGYATAGGAPFAGSRERPRAENFKSDGIPVIKPIGEINPTRSLQQQQKEAAEQELKELAFIKASQEQAATNLLPASLSPEVVQLTERQFLIGSGPQAGIDTKGSSLRNSSYDIRREPTIARLPVSLWNNSNLDAPMFRKPLE